MVLAFDPFQGKPTEASSNARQLDYGELDAVDHLPGAEVLESAETEPTKDQAEKGQDSARKTRLGGIYVDLLSQLSYHVCGQQ